MIKRAQIGMILGCLSLMAGGVVAKAPVVPQRPAGASANTQRQKPVLDGMFGAPERARKVAREASTRVTEPALDEENPEFKSPMTEPRRRPAALPVAGPPTQAPRALTTFDLVKAYSKDANKAEAQFEGVIVTGSGTVEKVEHLDKWTMVTVHDPVSKDRFVYRWIFAKAPYFEIGEKVKLTSIYDFRDIDGKGRRTFNLDVAKSDPKSAASLDPKSDIYAASKGWELNGFVTLGQGFVAVFKKKDKGVLYARVGQQLEKGVIVANVNERFVTLKVAGKPITMAP